MIPSERKVGFMKQQQTLIANPDRHDAQPDEVIGILMAISIVSKRLAKRLSALDERMSSEGTSAMQKEEARQ